ncbi:hypothetical protein BGX23_001156 [Mortierella sp. AD031]|nr:hypothetical protein BGX23_001156 [Mortierella sp. AD031]
MKILSIALILATLACVFVEASTLGARLSGQADNAVSISGTTLSARAMGSTLLDRLVVKRQANPTPSCEELCSNVDALSRIIQTQISPSISQVPALANLDADLDTIPMLCKTAQADAFATKTNVENLLEPLKKTSPDAAADAIDLYMKEGCTKA